MMPRGDLSHCSAYSNALAPCFKGWFINDVNSSTPSELAMQQRAGLETVHY